MTNKLFYGDNLEMLRKHIKNETVDLCYIDPPFNSKRNYSQIYNNIGKKGKEQVQAFIDTWIWDDRAITGFDEILTNTNGKFQPKLVDLIKGFIPVLGRDSLLAYLISMSLRITEIHRVLRPTGSFYLHCDPTASHYLKIVLDAIFLPCGGFFQNEIDWCYKSGGASKHHFSKKHDVLLFYTKSKNYTFNYQTEKSYNRGFKPYRFKGVAEFKDDIGWYTLVGMKDYWNVDMVGRTSAERLGYPTQKPEALLERIIKASSVEGDTILDAYCGCGTTAAVAQRLKRKWIGVDITYQAVAMTLKRIECAYGYSVANAVNLNGTPKDIKSAHVLAHKKDNRLKKEFEKWIILTYANNQAIINNEINSNTCVDGITFFKTEKIDNEKIVFQIKSCGVEQEDIEKLRVDMIKEQATLAVLITFKNPNASTIQKAKSVGQYLHQDMGRNYDVITIVTVQEIIENGSRLEIPTNAEVFKTSQKETFDV